MKLLYLLPEYVTNAGGGIITFYRHLLPLLAAQGHEVRVIVGSGVFTRPDDSPVNVDGVRVEYLSETLLRAQYEHFARYAALPGLRRFLAGAWAMKQQAADGDGFDLVETTDWGLLFLPWAVEPGPPTVVQLHGSSGQIDLYDPVRGEEVQGVLLRMFERAGLQQATTNPQACSASNAYAWERQIGRPVIKIPPAWKTLSPTLEAARNDRGVVIGRVQKWKGPDVLCEALALMGNHAPNIDWVGRDMPSGERGVTMDQQLRTRYPGIWGSRVTSAGQKAPAEALQMQARAQFAVIPSEWDTFNFTCVEAMAAATPVVCSSAAGASELIAEGINGFVFETGNAGSLADAMRRMRGMSSEARTAMGRAGQESVLRALDPRANAALRLAAYGEAVAASRHATANAAGDADWLRQAVAPQPGAKTSLAFLDLVPLKGLMGYTAQRTLRKLGL